MKKILLFTLAVILAGSASAASLNDGDGRRISIRGIPELDLSAQTTTQPYINANGDVEVALPAGKPVVVTFKRNEEWTPSRADIVITTTDPNPCWVEITNMRAGFHFSSLVCWPDDPIWLFSRPYHGHWTIFFQTQDGRRVTAEFDI